MIVALRVRGGVTPLGMVAFDGSNETLLTSKFPTVTTHLAVLVPLVMSAAVAVMVALPSATPTTTPPVYVTIPVGGSQLQVTPWLVALVGTNVGTRVSVPPTDMFVAAFNEMLVTGTSTSTKHVAVLPPSFVATIMEAVPRPLPVTLPLGSTSAILSLLLFQVTALLVALEGRTVAVRVLVAFTAIVTGGVRGIGPESSLNETLPTEISLSCTVTSHVAILLPS